MKIKSAIQRGFTLIEFAIVVVVIGILAAIAVPRFVDLQSQALQAAQDGTVAAARSALAISIAEQGGAPTLAQLAANVQDESGTASATGSGDGIAITIDGDAYKIQTYTDSACSSATSSSGDLVQCVGSVVAGT